MIVAASVVLGVVFLVAGVLKVSAPRQWLDQSAGLGVPAPVARAVPVAETVVGALLVTQIAVTEVAVAAGALLISFTLLLILRLSQGKRPPCACFGKLTTTPIGWSNVVRNVVLLALATIVAVGSA